MEEPEETQEQKKSLSKDIVAFAVGELQQEIIQLNENSKNVMAKVVNLICGRFQKEVQTALQQNYYCAQQKLILISRIEQQQASLSAMQEDNQTLRTELDSLIVTHNQYLDQLDQSQSELDHEKHLFLEQQQAQHLLHRHLEHFQASVDSLEEDNTLLREQLDKERSKNKYLEEQIALFEVKYIEISQLYESQQERNDQLSSSISHHDEKIRRLQRKIEEQDYIQSFTPELQINSDNNVSLQQKKTLREEEPNIRLSQSQDTFFCPPLPLSNIGKTRQLKSSREIQVKHDINSSLKKILNKSKMIPISHQKKPSSVHSKPEAAFTKRSIKELPEKVLVKDKLKYIFMDRVKYKIENDLKHHRQIDSLRCKLRAKENQKNKLQKELDQIKQSRSSSRASSMVLGRKTKQKSRKSSRCEPQGLWLQSQLKDYPRKEESSLLNKSYEELSQEKSEFECSPRATHQNHEQQCSSSLPKGYQLGLGKEKQFFLKKEDEFQEFNLLESRNSHHYLNLEIDIQQDISFKHEDPNLNESHSLSRSGNFGKRQRFPSIYSSRGSELLMYQDGGSLREDPLEEQHEEEERSPALMRIFIQGERQNRKALQHKINLSMQQKFEEDHLQVASSPYTQRKTNSISQFNMFFNGAKECKIQICSLGNLVQVIPKSRQLKCSQYYQQRIEPSPPPKKIFRIVQNLNFSVIGPTKQTLGIQTYLNDISDQDTQTLTILLQQISMNTDPFNLIRSQAIPLETRESEANTDIPFLKYVRTPTIQIHQILSSTDDKEVQWSKQYSMMTQQTERIQTSIQAQIESIEIGWNSDRRKLQHQKITNLTVLPSKREPKLGLYFPLIYSYSGKKLRNAFEVSKIQDLNIKCQKTLKKFELLNHVNCKIEGEKRTFNCVLQKAPSISIDVIKSKKTLQRWTLHSIALKYQKERTQLSLSSYLSLSLKPKSKNSLQFVTLQSFNVQCLKMRKELICVHSANIRVECHKNPPKLDFQKLESVVHYRRQKRDFSVHCQLTQPQLKLQSETASFVFRPPENVLLSGSSEFHSADQWKSLSFQSIDYHDLVLQNHKAKDVEDLSCFLSKDISKQSIKTKSFLNKNPLTPKPHLISQKNKFEKVNYNMQKSMASSQATNVKNCSPFTCSNFNTPQQQKSILSQVDHQQSEEESLKKYFCNIGSLHLLDSCSKPLSSQMMFKVDYMQVFTCLKDGKSFKFALHRGRVVMVSPTVASMELPALKLNSIKHQNGILIMGNCQLTIMGQKLTINRSNKFRIFKGEMPEGEWKICEVKIYQIKQSL